MKLKNLIIGFLLMGIFANVGVVFGDDDVIVNPEWKYTTNDVRSMDMTPDGKYLVVGDEKLLRLSKCIYLFNKNGSLLWESGTQDDVDSVSISSDGKYIVAGNGWYVYLFNNGGNLLWKYKTDDDVEYVSITPDGKYIGVGSWDDYVYLFNTNGDLLWKYLISTEAENLLNQAKTEYDKGN